MRIRICHIQKKRLFEAAYLTAAKTVSPGTPETIRTSECRFRKPVPYPLGYGRITK